jgi:hypothetical protein
MVPYLRTIDSSGTLCGDYYLIPQRSTTLIRWKVLDILAKRCWSYCLCLRHCRPPHSWTGSWAPPLFGGTITPCVDSLLLYGSSDGLSLSFKVIPKSKVCICIYILVFEFSLLLPRLGFISVSQSYSTLYIGLLFCLHPCG